MREQERHKLNQFHINEKHYENKIKKIKSTK